MKGRSFVLIGNPHAGRGHAARVLANTADALLAAGAATRGELSTSIEHARELADGAAAAGEVAVAIGGDGLVRAVAAGASLHRGTVGIVPCGRGNDFARMVGIADVAASIRVLLEAQPRPVDCIAVTTGTADGATDSSYEVAIGNVYLGFDSLSNVLANDMTVNLGPFVYTLSALRVALTMRPLIFRLVVDGVPLEYVGSGVVVANSSFYGRGVPVAPGADVHDGVLDVLTFEQVNRRSRVATMLALRFGRHVGRTGVRHLRARKVEVRIEPPLEAYSDGDPIARTPLTASVLPGEIELLRP
jgi:diacylglycerol kinase (ATP)